MRHLFLILLVWLATMHCGFAHSINTAYLDLVESPDGTTAVSWRKPIFPAGVDPLTPVYPEGVTKVSMEPARDEGNFRNENYVLRGAPKLWSGTTIGLVGESPNGTEVLVRLQLANGKKSLAVLANASDLFVVPAQPSRVQEAMTFLRLGFDHILMGVDHLLVVLGLLILVPNFKMLVKTITAFTVAHSITLAIATLGYASAPIPPLNVSIALSIFFLAPEIVRMRRGETSLTIEHPWVIAFAFGLLHGFGFSSGLTSLGLPREEIPLALLLFNVGVELGQLFFVLVIVGLAKSFKTLEIRWPAWAEALPTYTIGGLGAFWTIQRMAILVGAIK